MCNFVDKKKKEMSIKDNYFEILSSIPDNVQLVAVSKTKPVADIQVIYDCGQRIFGENKAQEIVEKQSQLPSDIEWHFIGHLQRNKVKMVIPYISCVESIDSLRLLKDIDNEARKINRVIDCLLEFKIAREMTKSGMTFEEGFELLNSDEYKMMNNIRIRGVMGMATFTDNEAQIRQEFQKLRDLFNELSPKFFRYVDYFDQISMGMSDDYQIAIEEGSTMVRVGSSIFGKR